jgi:hypothetical protein
MKYRIVKIAHKGITTYTLDIWSLLPTITEGWLTLLKFESLEDAEDVIEKIRNKMLKRQEEPIKEVIREFEL